MNENNISVKLEKIKTNLEIIKAGLRLSEDTSIEHVANSFTPSKGTFTITDNEGLLKETIIHGDVEDNFLNVAIVSKMSTTEQITLNNTKKIGENAFQNNRIGKIVNTDKITNIETNAFKGVSAHTNGTEVTALCLPSLQFLKNYAFQNSTIKTLWIGNSIAHNYYKKYGSDLISEGQWEGAGASTNVSAANYCYFLLNSQGQMVKMTNGAANEKYGWIDTGYNLPIEVEYGRTYTLSLHASNTASSPWRYCIIEFDENFNELGHYNTRFDGSRSFSYKIREKNAKYITLSLYNIKKLDQYHPTFITPPLTDADKNSGLFQYSLTGITKVYIDVPRNILTTFDYYANMSRIVTFICNDEEEFLTQEEFNATYLQ